MQIQMYTNLCCFNLKKKTEIDKRAMGKSENILDGYLAQQWFFSLIGKSVNERFLKICEIIKKRSYVQVRQEIIVYTNQMSDLREAYSKKLRNLQYGKTC